jgi:phosphoserine phosphatase RsbU/P
MFVTAFYLILSPDNGLVQYVNAGHNLPILRRANGDLVELHKGGMALGWFEDNPLIQDSVAMETGDLLVLYTDGVTDACNANIEEYGLDRFKATLSTCGGLTTQQALARVRDSITEFAGDAVASDDITLVAIRRI